MSSRSILLGPTDIRDLAAQAGIYPTKKLGQNFLLDANTVRGIVRRADLVPGQSVLEVGPGLGSLTLGLLEAGMQVGAVELDRALAALLPKTVVSRGIDPDRLTVVHEDALALTQLPTPAAGDQPTALVANLPYNVAVPILLTLLGRFSSLRTALVMVQLEVADRLVATPGSRVYGAPSAKTAWFGRASKVGSISRQVFWPVPNVDSALVKIVRHDNPAPMTTIDRQQVFAVIDAAFSQRRKTLRTALASWAGSPQNAERAVREAGIDPGRRGESLSVADFAAIAQAHSGLSRSMGHAGG
ncbi:16S rRNA (adenine(1518)-N(6)/adenine(1519)-N(6))-dimethyltransferase RsmA [Devriesea agamarum]|uniref:16S rRNA (adenine(1518)-N(6)/adenine(1519)-N(6))- dimethyltransferase RsmA n=1 Tax=Devriesea agamarum TaxID=472569 RepID=UPI00071D55B7|nr:16S rRNA (adenine(1518)-N(6)/adenine(1519)-N(6))-dimethyltransferase RsmA [Devriesea agamarum]